MYRLIMMVLGFLSTINSMNIVLQDNTIFHLKKGDVYFRRISPSDDADLYPHSMDIEKSRELFENIGRIVLPESSIALSNSECFFIVDALKNTLTIFDPDIIGLSSPELMLYCENGYRKSVLKLFVDVESI